MSLVQDPPDFSDPVWEGKKDGYIVECTPEACVTTSEAQGEMHCLSTSRYWVAQPPEGTGPLPRELAERAVAQMDLDMGQIGSTPPSTKVKADSIGIVGMPIWLWVSNPAENTTGPITRSDSEGDVSVTATGTLDRTEWTLAEDGEVYGTTTCAGSNAPGTTWSEAVMGPEVRPSPTCGFTAQENRRAGNITLTGTAYWTVEWTGGGQIGTIDVPGQQRSTPLTIGEAQVLTQ